MLHVLAQGAPSTHTSVAEAVINKKG